MQRRAAPASAARPELAKPIAGTHCSEFPADNWWHADVSQLPVHARSAAWLSHMDTDVDLHPDFGPSYGDGPNYGIPITVVGKKHKKSKVSFDYSDESDHAKYPLGRDTKIEGGRELRRRPARDHRRQGQVQALRALRHVASTGGAGTPAPGRSGR